MIVLDGSEGEGGGQILRNALALSLVTGQPFRVDNIRAKRSKPGLMRQHMTAIEAACAIGTANCHGMQIGASQIVFEPGKVQAGKHHFAIGTAGSTGLVLQTVLTPLMLAEAPSRLILEGGTHNIYAPPFDFIDRVFLPLINQMGPRVTARLVRHGFYPAGGGRIEVDIVPAKNIAPMTFHDRGALISVEAAALIAGLAEDIAQRELDAARPALDWPQDAFKVVTLPEQYGPGNILILEARFENTAEIVCGFGQLGVPAQAVGERAAGRMAGYLASTAFAGPYLADQLLLPMALAGRGSFTTVKPSQHARTAADIIQRFLPVRIEFVQREGGVHVVTLDRV